MQTGLQLLRDILSKVFFQGPPKSNSQTLGGPINSRFIYLLTHLAVAYILKAGT